MFSYDFKGYAPCRRPPWQLVDCWFADCKDWQQQKNKFAGLKSIDKSQKYKYACYTFDYWILLIFLSFWGPWGPFWVNLGVSGDHFGDQMGHICTQGVPGGCRDGFLMIFDGFWVTHFGTILEPFGGLWGPFSWFLGVLKMHRNFIEFQGALREHQNPVSGTGGWWLQDFWGPVTAIQDRWSAVCNCWTTCNCWTDDGKPQLLNSWLQLQLSIPAAVCPWQAGAGGFYQRGSSV